MNRYIGILLMLLSLAFATDSAQSNTVCLLRASQQTKCSVRGVHLDEKETATLKDLCQGNQTLNVATVRGAQVADREFFCGQENSYVWLPWNDFLAQVIPTAGSVFKVGNVYVGRNLLQQEVNAEQLCRIDLSSGHCVSLSGNESQNVIASEVLVQRLPLYYDLKTLRTGSWKNVTQGELVALTKTSLYNRKYENAFVQKVIPYELVREVHFDLPEDLQGAAQVNVYDETGRLDLRFDVDGAAKTLISKSVPAIKRMLPRTSIEVTVQGTDDRVLSKLNGDLVSVFDKADDKAIAQRFTRNLVLNRVDIGVQDVQIDFGAFQKLELKNEDFPSIEEGDPTEAPEKDEAEEPDNSVALFRNKRVYPEFQKYATIAYTVFFTTVMVFAFDIVRQLRKTRKMKANGTYKKVPTYEETQH